MRKIRDVLRLKYGLGRSHREIAATLRISHSTVGGYVQRAGEAGVSWPLPDELDDARLEAALYPPTPPSGVPRREPDWARVHRELARHKGVTLQLLWLEYREAHPGGYQYSRFCDRYRQWRGRLDVVLRQVYRAGEKAFVDYAGPTVGGHPIEAVLRERPVSPEVLADTQGYASGACQSPATCVSSMRYLTGVFCLISYTNK